MSQNESLNKGFLCKKKQNNFYNYKKEILAPGSNQLWINANVQ